MQRLRSRWCSAFFFVLISMGQGYPLAYACDQAKEEATQEEEKCSCNQAGRKCIHGCELKKKKTQIKSKKQKGDDQHQARWISPNCTQKKHQKALEVLSEPFLLKRKVSWAYSHFLISAPLLSQTPSFLVVKVDVPPPRA